MHANDIYTEFKELSLRERDNTAAARWQVADKLKYLGEMYGYDVNNRTELDEVVLFPNMGRLVIRRPDSEEPFEYELTFCLDDSVPSRFYYTVYDVAREEVLCEGDYRRFGEYGPMYSSIFGAIVDRRRELKESRKENK
jgi:hypothetical protein